MTHRPYVLSFFVFCLLWGTTAYGIAVSQVTLVVGATLLPSLLWGIPVILFVLRWVGIKTGLYKLRYSRHILGILFAVSMMYFQQPLQQAIQELIPLCERSQLPDSLGFLKYPPQCMSSQNITKEQMEQSLVIDFRSAKQYERSHLTGAIHIAENRFDPSQQEKLKSHIIQKQYLEGQDISVILYCDLGFRSSIRFLSFIKEYHSMEFLKPVRFILLQDSLKAALIESPETFELWYPSPEKHIAKPGSLLNMFYQLSEHIRTLTPNAYFSLLLLLLLQFFVLYKFRASSLQKNLLSTKPISRPTYQVLCGISSLAILLCSMTWYQFNIPEVYSTLRFLNSPVVITFWLLFISNLYLINNTHSRTQGLQSQSFKLNFRIPLRALVISGILSILLVPLVSESELHLSIYLIYSCSLLFPLLIDLLIWQRLKKKTNQTTQPVSLLNKDHIPYQPDDFLRKYKAIQKSIGPLSFTRCSEETYASSNLFTASLIQKRWDLKKGAATKALKYFGIFPTSQQRNLTPVVILENQLYQSPEIKQHFFLTGAWTQAIRQWMLIPLLKLFLKQAPYEWRYKVLPQHQKHLQELQQCLSPETSQNHRFKVIHQSVLRLQDQLALWQEKIGLAHQELYSVLEAEHQDTQHPFTEHLHTNSTQPLLTLWKHAEYLRQQTHDLYFTELQTFSKLLQQVGEQLNIGEQIFFLTADETLQMCNTKQLPIPESELEQRQSQWQRPQLNLPQRFSLKDLENLKNEIGHSQSGHTEVFSSEVFHNEIGHSQSGHTEVFSSEVFHGVMVSGGEIFQIGKPRLLPESKLTMENFEWTKQDILLTQQLEASVVPKILNAGGVISKQGGMLSHAAILLREQQLPGVFGVDFLEELSKQPLLQITKQGVKVFDANLHHWCPLGVFPSDFEVSKTAQALNTAAYEDQNMPKGVLIKASIMDASYQEWGFVRPKVFAEFKEIPRGFVELDLAESFYQEMITILDFLNIPEQGLLLRSLNESKDDAVLVHNKTQLLHAIVKYWQQFYTTGDSEEGEVQPAELDLLLQYTV